MVRLGFSSCVDDLIKCFVYVVPEHMRLIRWTKIAKEN